MKVTVSRSMSVLSMRRYIDASVHGKVLLWPGICDAVGERFCLVCRESI